MQAAAKTFAASREHILGELALLDLRLGLAVRDSRKGQSSLPDDQFRGLMIDDEQVDSILNGQPTTGNRATIQSGPLFDELRYRRQEIDAAKEEALTAGVDLRLEQLRQLFGLDNWEAQVVVLCLALELERKYETLYGYLQDDVGKKRPTVGLALNLFCASWDERIDRRRSFLHPSPLIRHGLVFLQDDPYSKGATLLGSFLRLDQRVAEYLLDSDLPDSRLASGASLVESVTTWDDVILPPETKANLICLAQGQQHFTTTPVKQTEHLSTPSAQSGEPLRIYTLGRFRVCRGGQEVDRWRSNKAKGILKLLVTHLGRPLPKDVFIEALWPDQLAQPANNSFRVALHQLRQTLRHLEDSSSPCPYLSFDGANHFLHCDNPDIPVWVDIAEFRSRWQSGRALEKAGRHLEAITEFVLAAELYRGDFLEEDIYEDWSIIRREALVDVYLSLLGKVSAFYLKSSDYESCIEFCQRILDRDCCREDAYQHMMFCYGKLGQRSRSARWFELCQEALRRELDCEVSRETVDLYQRINDGGVFDLPPF